MSNAKINEIKSEIEQNYKHIDQTDDLILKFEKFYEGDDESKLVLIKLDIDKIKGDYSNLTSVLMEVESQIVQYVKQINSIMASKKQVEYENLVLRKEKDIIEKQLRNLEPLKKLGETVDTLKFELNQKTLLMEENDLRLKKEIDRLNDENILLEKKNKHTQEFKLKQELELKSKDYYLKQIRDHGLIPETYEEELTKAMQKIVQMESELQLQQKYFKDTKNLYEDKLATLNHEQQEILNRERKGIQKIQDLNEQIKYFTEQNIDESSVSKELFMKTKRIYEAKIEELRNEINKLRDQIMTNKHSEPNDDDSMNTILKLNFKNTKDYKIDANSKLDGVAGNKLFNNTHELQVKVDFLEKELYNTEQHMQKKVKFYTSQLSDMLGFMHEYGLTPNNYDIDKAETFVSTRSMLAAVLNKDEAKTPKEEVGLKYKYNQFHRGQQTENKLTFAYTPILLEYQVGFSKSILGVKSLHSKGFQVTIDKRVEAISSQTDFSEQNSEQMQKLKKEATKLKKENEQHGKNQGNLQAMLETLIAENNDLKNKVESYEIQENMKDDKNDSTNPKSMEQVLYSKHSNNSAEKSNDVSKELSTSEIPRPVSRSKPILTPITESSKTFEPIKINPKRVVPGILRFHSVNSMDRSQTPLPTRGGNFNKTVEIGINTLKGKDASYSTDSKQDYLLGFSKDSINATSMKSNETDENLIKKLKQQRDYINKFSEWKTKYKKELKDAYDYIGKLENYVEKVKKKE